MEINNGWPVCAEGVAVSGEGEILLTDVEAVRRFDLAEPGGADGVDRDGGGVEERAKLALEIDRTMRERAPASWKGNRARESQVLNAVYPLMNRDRDATMALFEVVKNQRGWRSVEVARFAPR